VHRIVQERLDLKGISIAKVEMIEQEKMGEAFKILDPFPVGFIDNDPPPDPSGTGGLDGHTSDIFKRGMDKADRTVSHNLFHIYTFSNCLVE
jgi:hypothetical protein